MKKFVYIDRNFEPTDELDLILKDKKGIIYDENIIKYVEQHSNYNLWGRMVCRGKESSKYRIGFAGACQVLEVDETRKWKVKLNNHDLPYIQYVNIKVDEYGYVDIVEDWR